MNLVWLDDVASIFFCFICESVSVWHMFELRDFVLFVTSVYRETIK